MKESVDFYVNILDFEHHGSWPEKGDPSFSILLRDGQELHLSSHNGDGTFGNAISIIVSDIDNLFSRYLERGLDVSRKRDSPVHQRPTDQTWGAREFYVTDPNDNTIRFIRRNDILL